MISCRWLPAKVSWPPLLPGPTKAGPVNTSVAFYFWSSHSIVTRSPYEKKSLLLG
jgi:hypothetical protein